MSFRVIQFHPPEGGRSFDPSYEVICDGDGCDRRLKPQDGNEYANQVAEEEGWQVTELRNSIGAIYGSRHLCPECRKYQKPKIVPVDGICEREGTDGVSGEMFVMSSRQGGKQRAQQHLHALDLVRHSGLNAIANACHRLAVARGKYPSTWTYAEGARQMIGECREWLAELELGNEVGAKREFGDIMATVLSIGHHMGYYLEDELRATIQRNAERAREGV